MVVLAIFSFCQCPALIGSILADGVEQEFLIIRRLVMQRLSADEIMGNPIQKLRRQLFERLGIDAIEPFISLQVRWPRQFSPARKMKIKINRVPTVIKIAQILNEFRSFMFVCGECLFGVLPAERQRRKTLMTAAARLQPERMAPVRRRLGKTQRPAQAPPPPCPAGNTG